ncbi:MAG: NADH-quinone oxidoreductase subunit C [Desulfovibrionaceae bacterium]|nr:NADH-quinone oxidoreductase subunit C [Desulfovibrionaceae bacterium]
MTRGIGLVAVEDLLAEVAERKARGLRLAGMTCVELDRDSVDLIYHFDLGPELENFRVTAPKDRPIPSICGLYPAAFLNENEIQGQFGLRFEGLDPDFGATLFLDAESAPAPYCRYNVLRTKGGR